MLSRALIRLFQAAILVLLIFSYVSFFSQESFAIEKKSRKYEIKKNQNSNITTPLQEVLPEASPIERRIEGKKSEIGIKPYYYFSSVRNQGRSTKTPVTIFTDLHYSFGPNKDEKESSGSQVWSSLLHFTGVYTVNDSKDWFVDAPEAWIGYQLSENIGLHIGRKSEVWSLADQDWNFGLWQARTRWDYLQSSQVGLLGLFSSIELSKQWNFKIFLSPLFVPERGPQFKLKDDYIHSQSPWFNPVPDSILFLGKNIPIKYYIDVPKTSDLIFNSQVVSQLRYLSEDQSSFLQLSYAYKPIHQLVFHYKGYFDISDPTKHSAPVTLRPEVHFHHLTSLEGSYVLEKTYGFFMGLTYDSPVDKNLDLTADSPWTRQVYQPAWIFTPTFSYSPQIGILQNSKISLAYLRVWGGEVNDTGTQKFGASSGSIFESRYTFKDAIRVSLAQDLSSLFSFSNTFDVSYLYDAYMEGGLFSAVWSSRFYREKWKTFFGIDILGTRNSQLGVGNNGPSFLSRYQANDRLYGGVSYVF